MDKLSFLNSNDTEKKIEKFRSSSISEKSKSKLKKKRKKEKREKKSKKKKKKHRKSSSDESSSDSDEEQCVKKLIESNDSKSEENSFKKPLEREEWMSLPGIFPTISDEKRRDKGKSKKSEEEKYILDRPGQSGRELNPYWKDGGTGLPEEQDSKINQTMDINWLKKSLQRAKEMADEKGIPLEQVAAERWGSLENILSLINEAERNHSRESRSHHEHRRFGKYSDSRDYHYKRHDSSDRDFERKERPAFKKPKGDDNYSVSSSRRESSGPKKWQKPEVREKLLKERSESSYKEIENYDKFSVSSSRESNLENNTINDDDNILTEEELNKLGAKIVKAEIMGNDELAAELKLKLQKAREMRKLESSRVKEETVILTRTDAKGITRPLEPRADSSNSSKDRKRKKMVQTHTGGERVRYFADDDKYSLNEMFQSERGKSSKEDDEMFVKLASKSGDMDELFEQNITYKNSDAKQDARERSQAIKEHKKKTKSLENCLWCLDSERLLKHMIIAVGSHVYLSLPAYSSLTTGHCLISPMNHVLCQTQLDEDVYAEIKLFKKTLTKMFEVYKKIPVFFEVAMNFHSYHHMQVICVPLSLDEGNLAPMYFKKALLECESEWSNNKKIVDLKEKDIQRAIPKGLPYFEVDFGNHSGFAHVIENEKLFPKNFAQEIIGGMLDVDYSLWRKPRRENFEDQTKKVIEFTQMWKPYDFTGGQKL
ncbi:CWF19-like protein 2 [Leptopilina heterotoma]|uniref:CWF19-like protein 2 n=1 Tax=Leptopilina heterotoma TaxID=63436 RepID=UPI001CAA0883|nr:CWF19-like protein 2 [Leptopilina heterotoma]